jgi:hypothetical protein
LSCFLPYKIYNQTWYSVICETWPDRIFYTEKLAKPLIGQRLFVLIGAQHMLKHLRNFGFKTFGTVIDESYDDIEENELRWQMAWNQIENLSNQDPKSIYEKIQSTVDHNYKLIMSQNWLDLMQTQFKTIQNQPR